MTDGPTSHDACQADEATANTRSLIASYYTTKVEAHSHGPIGELVRQLATGILDQRKVEQLKRAHGLAGEEWYRKQVADIALGFIEDCLADGALSEHALADIHALNACLSLDKGAYFKLRPAEVGALLGEELDRILDDDLITDAEELYQVELQAAFGLGYDEYLLLTRRAFERAFAQLSRSADMGGPSAVDAKRKLKALEPIYRLATAIRRTPGALY
jgi:hypothetical protein